MTRTFSAFISHSSKDAAFAMQLVASLEARGLTAWVAPRDVDPGAPWAAEIDRGIAQSACFILVLSESANLSQAVLNEVTLAFNKGKPVFPVRIEDVAPSEALNFYVASVHWIDALDGLIEDRLERLIGAMRDDGERARRAAPGKKVEDPFTVPLPNSGPILAPPPRADERWVDAFDHNTIMKELKPIFYAGTPQRNQRLTLAWDWSNQNDEFILYAQGEALVYAIYIKPKFYVSSDKDDAFERLRRFKDTITDISAGLSDEGGRTDKSLAIATNRGLFQRDFYRNLEILDRDSAIYSGSVSCVAVSADRRSLAHLCAHVGVEGKSILARLLGRVDKSAPKGRLLRIFDANSRSVRESKVVPDVGGLVYTQVLWSPSGNYIGICDWYGPRLSIIPTSVIGNHLSFDDYLPKCDPDIEVSYSAWHPTEDFCATGYRTKGDSPEFGFFILDASSREPILRQQISRRSTSRVVAWSPDGSFLALGGFDQAVVLWDFRRGSQSMLLGHSDTIEGLDFSPDGQRLLSSGGGKVFLWDRENPNRPLATFEGRFEHVGERRIRGSAWSPSGRMFAMFSGDGIRVLELA